MNKSKIIFDMIVVLVICLFFLFFCKVAVEVSVRKQLAVIILSGAGIIEMFNVVKLIIVKIREKRKK